MRLLLNGEARECEAVTIAGLLEACGVQPERVVVARNGDVVARERWSDPLLAEGDVVEIVRAVAGG